MSQYFDDNFGVYDMGDSHADRDETVEFYKDVQRRSVSKICSMCGRKVKLLPHYDKCNSCADAIERGLDY